MSSVLRVVIADDEGPARRFLADLLARCADVELVGEGATGRQALGLIETLTPDLALLDLQMPELGGLDVVRSLPADDVPLVAFVTAFDDLAVEAFELNAVDYLLKPVEFERLQQTIDRARTRLAQAPEAESRAAMLARAEHVHEHLRRPGFLERIPVRHRSDVLLLPVRQIASIVSERELLHITMLSRERHTVAHRLHLLEERLDPRRFVRLSRGTLVNVEAIARVSPMPGGTYMAILSNGQELSVSRLQSRVLRESLLKL